MMSKPKEIRNEGDLFCTPILDFSNENHPLIVLANKIDWTRLEGISKRSAIISNFHFSFAYSSEVIKSLIGFKLKNVSMNYVAICHNLFQLLGIEEGLFARSK